MTNWREKKSATRRANKNLRALIPVEGGASAHSFYNFLRRAYISPPQIFSREYVKTFVQGKYTMDQAGQLPENLRTFLGDIRRGVSINGRRASEIIEEHNLAYKLLGELAEMNKAQKDTLDLRKIVGWFKNLLEAAYPDKKEAVNQIDNFILAEVVQNLHQGGFSSTIQRLEEEVLSLGNAGLPSSMKDILWDLKAQGFGVLITLSQKIAIPAKNLVNEKDLDSSHFESLNNEWNTCSKLLDFYINQQTYEKIRGDGNITTDELPNYEDVLRAAPGSEDYQKYEALWHEKVPGASAKPTGLLKLNHVQRIYHEHQKEIDNLRDKEPQITPELFPTLFKHYVRGELQIKFEIQKSIQEADKIRYCNGKLSISFDNIPESLRDRFWALIDRIIEKIRELLGLESSVNIINGKYVFDIPDKEFQGYAPFVAMTSPASEMDRASAQAMQRSDYQNLNHNFLGI